MPRMPDGAILRSLLTAIGDLITASAVGTPARLGMGAALQVLRVNAAGTALEFAAASGLVGQSIRKTADETVTNSTTLQNDDHFLFSIGANEVWLVEIRANVVMVYDAGYPGLKVTWSLPAGASMLMVCFEFDIATDPIIGWGALGTTPGTAVAKTLVHQNAIVRIWTTLVNGATPGTAQFQWASNQLVGATGSTTFKLNSHLVAQRV